jgi:hypothetical protein
MTIIVYVATVLYKLLFLIFYDKFYVYGHFNYSNIEFC